ncbi:glycosyltransferase [bacterium]|nr:glycosyltransferase [bacterium]
MQLNKIKQYIKKHLPIVAQIYKHYESSQKIVNYFSTNYKKNALLSYTTYPFKKGQCLSHTNYYEAMSWAKILNKTGYNVDVIHYDYSSKINFSKYSVLIGFGDAFQKYFESGFNHVKTIYYGTGMHVCHQNHVTLKRIKDVYLKRGKWLCCSARFVEKTWTHQTFLVDAIIALGNEICKESYSKFYDGPIYSLPAPFFKVLDAHEILSQGHKNNIKGFLWFGSSGLIHKGLDLVLEVFANHPKIKLHICGPIKNELDFEKVYFKELYQLPNIITHGFVDISSQLFKEILQDCAFVISPSCSEGGCTGTLTAIGNGALIPIITKETTISTGFEIWINDLSVKDVEKAIDKALKLTENETLELRKRNLEYVLKYHSQENYYKELENAIIEILEVKNEL